MLPQCSVLARCVMHVIAVLIASTQYDHAYSLFMPSVLLSMSLDE